MVKRKHRRGNKPTFGTVTGRFSNTQPELHDLRHKPLEQAVKLVGVDFGATETRIIAWVAGRRYSQPGKSEFWRLAGPDVCLEPLGAGLSRILSRGAPQPVRYSRGG